VVSNKRKSMPKDGKIIRETEVQNGNQTRRVTEVDDPIEKDGHERNVAQRVIWYIFGIIIALLLLRFIFALLGANQNNGLAEFVYGVTAPLVSPFTNLFAFDGVQYGVSKFELFTLVAIAIYMLLAYGISQLFNLNRR
jgi:uncharacterized protein YggT (Ycf19 family)